MVTHQTEKNMNVSGKNIKLDMMSPPFIGLSTLIHGKKKNQVLTQLFPKIKSYWGEIKWLS